MHAATIYDAGMDDKLMFSFHGPNTYTLLNKLFLTATVGGGGGGDFHMLGYGDVPPIRFSQGILFANFSCLCSLRYAFQPHSMLCVPSGYTVSRFLIVFCVLSGSGFSSPSGTTPSILVSPAATLTHP